MEEVFDVIYMNRVASYLNSEYPHSSPFRFEGTREEIKEQRLFAIAFWVDAFKDYPMPVIKKALRNACLHSGAFCPTIGQVYEEIDALYAVNDYTAEELWSMYEEKFGYIMYQLRKYQTPEQNRKSTENLNQLFEVMPFELKGYLPNVFEMCRVARICTEDYTGTTASVEKGRFLKSYGSFMKREKTRETMSPELLQIVTETSEQKKIRNYASETRLLKDGDDE